MTLVHIWNSDNNQVVIPTSQTNDEIVRLIELKCKDLNYPFLKADNNKDWIGLYNVNSCIQITLEEVDAERYDFLTDELCYFS